MLPRSTKEVAMREEAAQSLRELNEVVERLRAPGGCPWDRAQTHRSLRPSLLEETYETLEAIDSQGTATLREELGDLLLQVLMHSAIAAERPDGFDIGDVDFVVEAVPERMEIKQSVFAELDAATPGHAILASNTSSLSITEIGEATLRPEKVVGFHYFYPASIMPLIEIVEGEETSAETVSAAVTFAQAIRKQPITCAEVPGFVVNRILNSGISEVWREQEEKSLSIKKIDEGVGAAGVVPIGPYYLVA